MAWSICGAGFFSVYGPLRPLGPQRGPHSFLDLFSIGKWRKVVGTYQGGTMTHSVFVVPRSSGISQDNKINQVWYHDGMGYITQRWVFGKSVHRTRICWNVAVASGLWRTWTLRRSWGPSRTLFKHGAPAARSARPWASHLRLDHHDSPLKVINVPLNNELVLCWCWLPGASSVKSRQLFYGICAGHRSKLCLPENDRQAFSFQPSGSDLLYRHVGLLGQTVGWEDAGETGGNQSDPSQNVI